MAKSREVKIEVNSGMGLIFSSFLLWLFYFLYFRLDFVGVIKEVTQGNLAILGITIHVLFGLITFFALLVGITSIRMITQK